MPTPSFYLKSLTLRAFRSVVEEQVIPLPTKGMHLLLGPSGAGKTTIGEGIAFALGYSNFSATDLQSWDWLTTEPLRDILEVETAKGTLRVTRGKAANILMPGEGKPRTSAKAVKEGLTQALGIDPEQYLAPLTYRSQKTPGLFLSMVDSEKKSFLTQLLGLEKFESAAEKAVATISSLVAELERAYVRHQTLSGSIPPEPAEATHHDLALYQAAVDAAEEEAEKLRVALEEMRKYDLGLTENHVAAVNLAKNGWHPKLVAAKAAFEGVPQVDATQHLKDLEAVRFAVLDLRAKSRGEVMVLEKELETTRQFQTSLAALADKKLAAERTLARAKKDIAALEARTCYTCGQAWNQNINAWTAKKEEHDLAVKTIADADAAAAQGPAFVEAATNLRERIASLKTTDPVPQNLIEDERRLVGLIASAKSERDAEVANLKAEFHRLKADAEAAVAVISATTPEEERVRRSLSDLNNIYNQATNKVSSFKQTLAAAKRENDISAAHYGQSLAQRTKAVAAATAAEFEMKAAESALNQERDFLAMVRGFLSYIFDETLARIADATNARLALIPNVSDLTIRFASERETGTGKLRQEITAVCEKNGHIIPLKAGTSGGMYTAVELAIDLSLADVIADRTGVYPGWLILDEAFEGLDDPCKAACFDMLKDISKDRAVFVVDHTESMKELFDSKIRVDFDGARSKVVLQ